MRINTNSICLLLFTFLLSWGCKKKIILPSITTLSVSNIFANEATSGGVISSQGTGNILSRGVVWSTSPNPTISLSTKTTDSSGVGTFSSKLFGLSANTKYYVRAYATIASGTTYGNEVSFTTNDVNISDGLVAYYPFSGNAGDSSGNVYHGTVIGATPTTDRFGFANKAFSFDGRSSKIFINHSFFNTGWNEYTITCWINLNQISNPNNPVFSNIIFNSSPHNHIALVTNWGQTSKYSIWIGTPNTGWNIFQGSVSNQSTVSGKWKHISFTKKMNEYTLFVDGQVDRNWINNNIVSSNLMKLYLGSADPLASNEVFNGKLDEFRFYNRALKQSEITYLANN